MCNIYSQHIFIPESSAYTANEYCLHGRLSPRSLRYSFCPATPTSNGRSSRPSSTHSTPLESAEPVSSPESDGMRLWPRPPTPRELHLPPSSNGLQAVVGRQRASRDRQEGEPRSGRGGEERGGRVTVMYREAIQKWVILFFTSETGFSQGTPFLF